MGSPFNHPCGKNLQEESFLLLLFLLGNLIMDRTWGGGQWRRLFFNDRNCCMEMIIFNKNRIFMMTTIEISTCAPFSKYLEIFTHIMMCLSIVKVNGMPHLNYL